MTNTVACLICGSTLEKNRRYLAPIGENRIRDFAYSLPSWALEIIGFTSARLREKLKPVITNKKFFGNKDLYWCSRCHTGIALPLFQEEVLSSYYEEFYWEGRGQHDEYFNDARAEPRESRLNWVRAQLDWVDSYGIDFSTAMDFGAGDCAGAYLMSKKCGTENICVVDSSTQARSVAESYGVRYFKSLDEAPVVDFLYGSHSIEHAADLMHTLKHLQAKMHEGAYMLLETPNVADKQVFQGLVLTPHTFTLSRKSFEEISMHSNLELIAVEEFGQEWQKGHNNIRSQARTDLRVILRKVSVKAANAG